MPSDTYTVVFGPISPAPNGLTIPDMSAESSGLGAVCRATVGRFETDPTRCRRSPSLHILQRYANAVGARITIKEQDA